MNENFIKNKIIQLFTENPDSWISFPDIINYVFAESYTEQHGLLLTEILLTLVELQTLLVNDNQDSFKLNVDDLQTTLKFTITFVIIKNNKKLLLILKTNDDQIPYAIIGFMNLK
jgi:hypothetical protein